MKPLIADLTEQEWDYIGRLLMKQPYHEVVGLITKLQQQLGDKPAPPPEITS